MAAMTHSLKQKHRSFLFTAWGLSWIFYAQSNPLHAPSSISFFFNLFSSMAVWKNSQVKEWRNYDEAERVMFHKSNKWDAAEDILCRESTSGVQKHHQPGAPNDGFLLNTLKTLFTFRCLEMYSKQRYKICICSAILGELESFRSKLQGLVMSIQYFPENFRCNLK